MSVMYVCGLMKIFTSDLQERKIYETHVLNVVLNKEQMRRQNAYVKHRYDKESKWIISRMIKQSLTNRTEQEWPSCKM